MFNSLLISSGARNCAIALTSAALLSACMVGPDYQRPEIDVPAGWRFGATQPAEISNVAWWDQFQDPALSSLVRTALANNKDVKVATANVDQAAAQYGIALCAVSS
jgi:multidrug efflux system outer membrane protein